MRRNAKAPSVQGFDGSGKAGNRSFVTRAVSSDGSGSGAPSRRSRGTFGLICLALIALGAMLGGSALPAAADTACSNESLRVQSNVNPTTSQPYSTGLPECRAYEMVSPLEKQAHDFSMYNTTSIQGGATASGNAVGGTSGGSFPDAERATNLDAGNGTPYLSQRTASGWTTAGAFAPAGLLPGFSQGVGGAVYSEDLSRIAACNGVEENNVGQARARAVGIECTLRRPDGTWIAGPVYEAVNSGAIGAATILGASSDLSHIVFVPGTLETKLLPNDTAHGAGFQTSPYEVVGLESGSPTLRLINVDNDGKSIGGGNFGVGGGTNPSGGLKFESYHAISEDGNTIYFNATPEGGVQTIYARIDGSRTVTVSNPSPAECTACSPTPAAATYQGASADGSKVFFTTTQQLVDADTDSSTDVYEYELGALPGHHVTQVSAGGAGDLTPGTGARVLGITSTSKDGSQVYFVAQGLLTTVPNGYGQTASPGASNLFAYDTVSNTTHFVATLAPGDSGLWVPTSAVVRGPAQQTPDGSYLVFATVQPLAADDTDGGASDAYRYDAASGELVRVSIGEPDFPASNDGNTPNRNATVAQRQDYYPDQNADNVGRAISDDGSTIVFSTPEQLQADDVNNETGNTGCPSGSFLTIKMTGCDVYVWRDGAVRMVSDGQDPGGADAPIKVGLFAMEIPKPSISRSGSDVFFTTHSALVGQDLDTQTDIYDARVDGGFPYVAPTICGDTDACRGPASQAPPPEAAPATPTFTGSGNAVTPPPKKAHPKKKHAGKKHAGKKQGRKRHARRKTTRSHG